MEIVTHGEYAMTYKWRNKNSTKLIAIYETDELLLFVGDFKTNNRIFVGFCWNTTFRQ